MLNTNKIVFQILSCTENACNWNIELEHNVVLSIDCNLTENIYYTPSYSAYLGQLNC